MTENQTEETTTEAQSSRWGESLKRKLAESTPGTMAFLTALATHYAVEDIGQHQTGQESQMLLFIGIWAFLGFARGLNKANNSPKNLTESEVWYTGIKYGTQLGLWATAGLTVAALKLDEMIIREGVETFNSTKDAIHQFFDEKKWENIRRSSGESISETGTEATKTADKGEDSGGMIEVLRIYVEVFKTQVLAKLSPRDMASGVTGVAGLAGLTAMEIRRRRNQSKGIIRKMVDQLVKLKSLRINISIDTKAIPAHVPSGKDPRSGTGEIF